MYIFALKWAVFDLQGNFARGIKSALELSGRAVKLIFEGESGRIIWVWLTGKESQLGHCSGHIFQKISNPNVPNPEFWRAEGRPNAARLDIEDITCALSDPKAGEADGDESCLPRCIGSLAKK